MNGFDSSYTEEEIARLTKNSKKARWAVTVVLEDETLYTTKWHTSRQAAKTAALGYLLTPEAPSDYRLFLSNQADFNEEINLL